MPLVTVKPKFQVTIPARLRKDINLHEGDVMEATIVEDGILLRPMDVVDETLLPTGSPPPLRQRLPPPRTPVAPRPRLWKIPLPTSPTPAENAVTASHEGCHRLQHFGVGGPD